VLENHLDTSSYAIRRTNENESDKAFRSALVKSAKVREFLSSISNIYGLDVMDAHCKML
jgi:uncharacterized protein YbcI